MNINNPNPFTILTKQFRQSVVKPSHQPPLSPQKSTFISKVQRFDNLSSSTPGPGTYNHNYHEKHTVDFKSHKNNDQRNKVPNQFAWIYDRSRMSFAQSNTSQTILGPGQYRQTETSNDNCHSNWAKVQRFASVKKVQSPIGPGSYSTSFQAKQKTAPLSVFKSKAPKSFIQEMIQKARKNNIPQYRNPEQNNQDEQVIKFDQTEYPIKQKVNKHSPVFLSKCQRPDLINQQISPTLGPGTYNTLGNSLSSPSNKNLVSAMHYNLDPIKTKDTSIISKTQLPGPGSYNTEMYKLQNLSKRQRQTLGIIFKEQRFKSNSQPKSQAPGPGQYMQKKFMMVRQQDIRLKNKGSFVRKAEKMHQFGTAPRMTLRNQNQIPFGQYQVKNFDIEYRINKQKEQYEKLKLMEVTLPAFNTKKH